jgi:hypothetical protein
MFVGYFIYGFMLGFIAGVVGGHTLAKRSEALENERVLHDQTTLESFRTDKAKQLAAEADYFDSVPESWQNK